MINIFTIDSLFILFWGPHIIDSAVSLSADYFNLNVNFLPSQMEANNEFYFIFPVISCHVHGRILNWALLHHVCFSFTHQMFSCKLTVCQVLCSRGYIIRMVSESILIASSATYGFNLLKTHITNRPIQNPSMVPWKIQGKHFTLILKYPQKTGLKGSL